VLEGASPHPIGLTRNIVVTVFSRVDLPEFKTFIRSEIVPLIE